MKSMTCPLGNCAHEMPSSFTFTIGSNTPTSNLSVAPMAAEITVDWDDNTMLEMPSRRLDTAAPVAWVRTICLRSSLFSLS